MGIQFVEKKKSAINFAVFESKNRNKSKINNKLCKSELFIFTDDARFLFLFFFFVELKININTLAILSENFILKLYFVIMLETIHCDYPYHTIWRSIAVL